MSFQLTAKIQKYLHIQYKNTNYLLSISSILHNIEKLCNKKAQICCLVSMETTTFATVLRSSEVSLHILVQKGACMSFPCFTVGLSRFTVWMKVKRPSYVLTMNGASR